MSRKKVRAYALLIFFALCLGPAFSFKLLAEVETQPAAGGPGPWEAPAPASPATTPKSLQKERDFIKAQVYFEEAAFRFSRADSYGAWENIAKSVTLAPESPRALELFIQVLASMDDPSILREIEAQRKKSQQLLDLTARHAIKEARALIRQGRLSQAAYLLERTLDTISYHPERTSCSFLIKEAEKEFVQAHLNEGRAQEILHSRITGLLEAARDYLEKGEVLKARLLVGLALILEPRDASALSLYRTVSQRPPVGATVYPKAVQPKRMPSPAVSSPQPVRAARPAQEAVPYWWRKEPAEPVFIDYLDWQLRIHQRLQEVISIDFTDTPLIDIIDFIRDAADVNMVVDEPGVGNRLLIPITIRLTDVRIESCLRWVLSLNGLDYTYRDEALFISDKEFIKEAGQVQIVIYDISDLAGSLRDFVAPGMGWGGGFGQ
ncbi:MAG: hypothetical protein AMS15_09730 [Planctomycetes bacterium DG_23]|nr:MAG: hypothetical protein AMS15_09730 [Planctomycetes bacterium DG_23]